MATLLLSAAGAAIGSGFGGSVIGLSGAVVGRAIGATVGRSLDQRLLGGGAEAVDVGKVDRFRVSGVGYGTPVQEVWGRMRVAGQIIWASRFQERSQQSGGGKGAPRSTTTTFSYSVSLAIALCRGPALRVGRIWADGVEIAVNSIDLRFYPGSDDQLPDPKIEAVEGAGHAPGYRGICYVVIENLEIGRFGNRVPQFSFEVVRQANVDRTDKPRDLIDAIKAVALIPGTGEYALATTPVYFNSGPGQNSSANIHSVQGETDFSQSLNQLSEDLPNCNSISLVVSWFGNDLRCDRCEIRPKVEQKVRDGVGMPWVVSGVTRAAATLVPVSDGRSIYGGTPADRSVIEAIQAIRASGKEVMFYPFILMDQLEENGLPDPWSDATSQPVLPWRGRVTLSKALGQDGSPDQTTLAETEVAAFLGNASPDEFTQTPSEVLYSGPAEWRYRRFILHYAHLCAAAGGVDAFCIGSEMRGMTQIRSIQNSFPFVSACRDLAAEVRAILGPSTKISYAADWSEYFGLQSGDDHFFNLDPLWADPNIDFIGIDNYMPVSDWRVGPQNVDVSWGSIYNLDYLEANIGGGEGFDWFYDSLEAEASQRRTKIEDTVYGEDWIFRFKDLRGWWQHEHHERIAGVRQSNPTAWIPGMKPFRFTEYGCPALDKGTNQPNKFLDPKSSESSLPRGSNGLRDDFLQLQYFLAMSNYWTSDANNPIAQLYSGRMVDFSKSHAWAWDSRPFPDFPGNMSVWSDGKNYEKGHWINGRTSNQPVSLVSTEICNESGIAGLVDASELHGVLRGFASNESATSRAKMQTLSLVFDFDAAESEGILRLRGRGRSEGFAIDEGGLAVPGDDAASIEMSRAPRSSSVDQVRLTYTAAESDFEIRTADAVYPSDRNGGAVESEVDVQLTSFEANSIADRWLAEARLASDRFLFALPISEISISPGEVVQFTDRIFRIERVEESGLLKVEAVRVHAGGYTNSSERGELPSRSSIVPSTPVFATFLDLPLLRGDEVAHAPYAAVAASPWPGGVSVWSSASENGFLLNTEIGSPAIIGETRTQLSSAPPALWDRGSVLRVFLPAGILSAASQLDVLNGANLAAIGDGSTSNWEIIQFSQANLVDTNTYELRGLLRGLAGTDATRPQIWPAGSFFVLMDGIIPQIDLPLSSRGLDRFYRVGASVLGYADKNVLASVEAFEGIGLRPFSVAHLKYEKALGGNISASWIRRTRIDGDSWQSIDVPLSEESEQYSVTVKKANAVIRRDQVEAPNWEYSQVLQLIDGIAVPFDIVVSQISHGFGAGPERSVTVV